MLQEWWKARGEFPVTDDMMPEGTSFILEDGGKPLVSMCYITTNVKAAAYCANFVSDPESDRETRRAAVKELFEFIDSQRKSRGYKNLLAFGYKPKLRERFEALGFRATLDVTSFVKTL
jgi:hypothetical protein